MMNFSRLCSREAEARMMVRDAVAERLEMWESEENGEWRSSQSNILKKENMELVASGETDPFDSIYQFN